MACEDNKCEKYGMHHYNNEPCLFCRRDNCFHEWRSEQFSNSQHPYYICNECGETLNKSVIYEYGNGLKVIVLHNKDEYDPLHEMEK